MNEELIRKLHDQAWGETHEKAIAVTETPIDFQKVLRERFAELIIQECIEQVITGPNGPAHYAVEAALRVKKHFGVEQ